MLHHNVIADLTFIGATALWALPLIWITTLVIGHAWHYTKLRFQRSLHRYIARAHNPNL